MKIKRGIMAKKKTIPELIQEVENHYRIYTKTFREYYDEPWMGSVDRKEIKEKIEVIEAELQKRLKKIVNDDTNEDVDKIYLHTTKYAYFNWKTGKNGKR